MCRATIGNWDTSGAIVSNPYWDIWIRQDRLILAWLRSSLSSSILIHAISCETVADLWQLLHRTCSARSQARALELKLHLQTLKKEEITYTEFLTCLNSITLQLKSIDYDISDQDISLCLFAGLPPEYNTLITSLTAGASSFSLADLHGHLLNYEARLNSQTIVIASLAYLG
jgi:gag-polypeptide of LTR copia-type